MKPPFVRSPYNYDPNKASDESGLACPEPTLTQQSFAAESDINFIADRYGLTGEMPQIQGAMWGQEFVGTFDFQAAQNQLVEAKRQFMELPARVRQRFNNDPAQLIEFLERRDDDSRKEAEFLGLVEKRPEIAPQSRLGDPGGKGDRDLPPLDSDPSGEPTTKKDKKSKTDT